MIATSATTLISTGRCSFASSPNHQASLWRAAFIRRPPLKFYQSALQQFSATEVFLRNVSNGVAQSYACVTLKFKPER
jgi:hypothetical protein